MLPSQNHPPPASVGSVASPGSRGRAGADTEKARQFLTFLLGAESYAVDVLSVQEIRGFGDVTPIPHAQPFVRGLMNLRGTVIPVIDMRLRFHRANPTDRLALVIVVHVESRQIGMLVDAVTAVISIAEASMRPPPEAAEMSDRAVSAVALVQNRLVLLLDLKIAVGLFPPDGAAEARSASVLNPEKPRA